MAMALKLWVVALLVVVDRTRSASVPLKFITSPTEKPITYFEDRPLPVERLPKPQAQNGNKDPAEDFLGGGNPLGSWKRWDTASGSNRTAGQRQPQSAGQVVNGEKTFTQQQILEKLFSDYHQHLEKQKNNATNAKDDQGRYHAASISIRPKPTSTISSSGQWPIELDTDEGTKVAASTNSQASYKLHRPGSSGGGGGGGGGGNRPPKDGWVSLEPIPWSSSKISKWTPNKDSTSMPSTPWNSPNHKPSWANQNHRPHSQSSSHSSWSDTRPSFSDNKPSYSENKPSYVDNRPLNWDDAPSKPSWSDTLHRPSWDTNKPSWTEANVKPSWAADAPIVTQNKPSWSQSSHKPSSSWTDLSNKPVFSHNRPSTSSSSASSSWTRPSKPADTHSNHPLGIITDGKPPEWPNETPSSSFQRPSAQRPSWNRPGSYSMIYKGDDEQKNNKPPSPSPTPQQQTPTEGVAEGGQWVLLSSTRGYTVPPGGRGQGSKRAFKFSPNTMSMSTNRGIRLTVLPAANGTGALSHGGLLEVDKTFESVEASAIKNQQQLQQHGLNQVIPKPQTKPIINTQADSVTIIAAPPGSVPPPGTPGGGNRRKGGKKGNKNKRRKGNKKKKRRRKGNKRPRPAQQVAIGGGGGGGGVQVFSATNPNDYVTKRKALIAAIGAGMLPATMAALVPMFLGRRRRRRDLMGDLGGSYAEYLRQPENVFVWPSWYSRSTLKE